MALGKVYVNKQLDKATRVRMVMAQPYAYISNYC